MKETMSSLDIKYCLDELDVIINAWTGKIYEIDGIFLFKFKPPGKERTDLIIEPGRRIHLTEMKYETPTHPPSFPMLLRKYLDNSKLVEINQPDLERIVELKFEGAEGNLTLIAELFGEGNLILCDENQKIIQPYRSKSWAQREIKAGEEYIPPPKKGKDFSEITKDELKSTISSSEDLVRGLASNLNMGGPIAEEICARAGLPKESQIDSLSKEDLDRLFDEINSLISQEKHPEIVYEEGKPSNVLPFQFKTEKEKKTENFDNFNEALDNYFQKISKQKIKSKHENKFEEKLNAVKSRLENQREQIQRLKDESKEAKIKADTVSTYHQKVDSVLDVLDKIRREKGWKDIEKEIKKSAKKGKDWAKRIDSIRPENGKVTIKLEGKNITLDLRLSSFENASQLYDRYKKSKKKIEGAKKALKKTKEELEKIKERGIKTQKKSVPKKTREKRWYERYRWCYSSEGKLIIAGRDRETNQEIVEKHMDPPDLYFHADIKGAPHTVIKTEGKETSEEEIREAGIFAGIHSQAWKRGLANVDVYWVKSDQVTQEAPSGEYLPKGSYMIKGDRNYLTVPLEVAVGLLKEDSEIIMCGPVPSIEENSKILAKLKPGPDKKSDLAHTLKKIIKREAEKEIDIDELMRILPPGSGMIEK